jgi:7-cyano-7-deazaguanine reductase
VSLGDVRNKPHGPEGLEAFENPLKFNLIELRIPEFSCLCPKTGQPDFAQLTIRYMPDLRCVESKSLKLYIWHFRDAGHFHEAVTQKILDDLCGFLEPRWMQILGEFNVRGGIYEKVLVEHYGTDPKGSVVVRKRVDSQRFKL